MIKNNVPSAVAPSDHLILPSQPGILVQMRTAPNMPPGQVAFLIEYSGGDDGVRQQEFVYATTLNLTCDGIRYSDPDAVGRLVRARFAPGAAVGALVSREGVSLFRAVRRLKDGRGPEFDVVGDPPTMNLLKEIDPRFVNFSLPPEGHQGERVIRYGNLSSYMGFRKRLTPEEKAELIATLKEQYRVVLAVDPLCLPGGTFSTQVLMPSMNAIRAAEGLPPVAAGNIVDQVIALRDELVRLGYVVGTQTVTTPGPDSLALTQKMEAEPPAGGIEVVPIDFDAAENAGLFEPGVFNHEGGDDFTEPVIVGAGQ